MKYALIISILLWGLILSVARAWAVPDYLLPIEPIRLNVVGELGANGLSNLYHARMMRGAKAYLRTYGIRIKLGKLYKRMDPYPFYRSECNNLDCFEAEFSAKYYEYNELRRDGELLHVIAPPVMVDGHLYFAGMSLQCSIANVAYSYSNAEKFNSAGDKRYRHSLNAMVQEILHTLGAQYDQSGPNIMHEAASKYVTGRLLPMNQKAKGEVLRCMR